MKPTKMVIRRTLSDNLKYLGMVTGVVAVCVFLIQTEAAVWLGNIGAVLFGGLGVIWLVFLSWRPVMIISDRGITVPFWRGQRYVSWANVKEIKLLKNVVNVYRGGRHVSEFIGIFVHDTTDMKWAGGFLHKFNYSATGWSEIPPFVISTQYTAIKGKEEEYIRLLREFRDAYQKENPPMRKVSQI
jgi:hypothetical protein